MIRRFDLLILLPVLLLIGFGLLTLYSVGHVPEEMKDCDRHYHYPDDVGCGCQ